MGYERLQFDVQLVDSSASVIYYYVTLDVDDPDDVLKLGMTARVDITTSQKDDALVVPIAA